MILYHFTALEHLESIRAQGLTRGLLPLSPDNVRNAVWLTSDKESAGHGLADGEPMPAAFLRHHNLPANLTFYDKRAIRITVVWPSDNVTPWLPWARKRLDPAWLEILNKEGGGLTKAKTWFISFSPIPPSAFRSIEILHESCGFP
jgi:hypothetical protein